MNHRISIIFLSFLIALCSLQCHQKLPGPGHLGQIEFGVNGDKRAIPHFEMGLLLLHSFEYQDAAEQFQLAQERDPDFAMAFWGEAMTKNHPLWNAQYYEEGKEILSRLADTPELRRAKAKSELEMDLLAGVEILFGEGDKYDRDKAYSEHMEKLYDKYRGHQEVAAFYALSLLGSVTDRDFEVYGKGAKVVESVLRENPDHPGALHYLIHSYDDPVHAHMALNAANKYSVVAPDAGHALHMPSHIYVALGMWDEVISSNIASYEASLKRKEKKSLGNNARNLHAFHWLQYGYLQDGMQEKAQSILNEIIDFEKQESTTRTRAYLSMMRATFIAETGIWDSEYSDIIVPDSDLNISIQSMNLFIYGMEYWVQEDIEDLKEVIAKLEKGRQDAEQSILKKGAAMCAGVGWEAQLPNQQDINHAHVMEMELRAMLAQLEGNSEDAEHWLKKAVTLEENTSFMFGPPSIVKPSHELYGEWLLDRGKPELAARQFEKSLERAPKRNLSVMGMDKTGAG